MQYQNLNQVSMTPVKGRVGIIPFPAVISCQVDPNSIQTLYPGSCLVLTTTTANMITVDKSTIAQNIFGVAIWNSKKPNGWTAGMKIEIAMPGTIIEMESSGVISRGSIVYQVVLNDQITTSSAGGATPIGIALDNATAANQLVRVYLPIGLTV